MLRSKKDRLRKSYPEEGESSRIFQSGVFLPLTPQGKVLFSFAMKAHWADKRKDVQIISAGVDHPDLTKKWHTFLF